ncbi:MULTISPECIES: L-lactate permease [Fusobacterium]|uniref:L-lactate permease n=1 Tax=Fusobacterium hominis TaxID=2764326 RepID=A0A7G9GWZ4_9FUSO|nr:MULTISPECIES: L-lactate permease [Fusobacterium]QNM15326.1 L-lactate permease [Fusobacterium hominis]
MVTFLLAILPIIFLVVALSGLKMTGYKACVIAMVITIVEALFIWKQGLIDVATGALEGFVMAIWPICLVIIAAVFTYNLVVHTKNMEVIKKMLASVSTDKRILVLIIAWGFGGFMEAMAGFGTAVAIPAGILVGLGFEPIFAAMVCLVANTTPVAFGSIGIPTVTAAKVAGIANAQQLASDIVAQQAIMIILVPFLIVYMVGKHEGYKGLKMFNGVWLITLIAGFGFLIPEYLVAEYMGAELPAIIGSVVCMGLVMFATKIFKTKNKDFSLDIEQSDKIDMHECVIAWSPFILVLIFLVFTSSIVPFIHDPLASIKTSIQIYTGPGAKPYTFVWLATPGVLIIIAAVIGGFIQKCPFSEIISVFIKTVKQMVKTVITIMAVLAMAKIMGYSGMTQTIADFIVSITGHFYPLVAPLIGSIGTFVTGSATSSSVLFAKLQSSTAEVLNMNPAWMVAANTAGSTAGKIISPQSIAVATASAGIVGTESKILVGVVKYYVIFIVVFGLVTYFGVV